MVLVETPVTNLVEAAIDNTKAAPAAIETVADEPQTTELAEETKGMPLCSHLHSQLALQHAVTDGCIYSYNSHRGTTSCY